MSEQNSKMEELESDLIDARAEIARMREERDNYKQAVKSVFAGESLVKEIADLRAKLQDLQLDVNCGSDNLCHMYSDKTCIIHSHEQDREEIADLKAKLAEVTKRHDDLWEMDRKIIGDLNAKLAEVEGIIRQHFTSTQPDLPALVRQLLQAWISERDNAITAEQRAREAETALHAWQKAFGTTQLDHALEFSRLKAEKGEG